MTSEAVDNEELEAKESKESKESDEDSSSSSSDEDPSFHLMLAKQKLVSDLRNLGLRAECSFQSG